MKTIFFFLVTAFWALSPIFAQAPAIQWQNTIGGNFKDYLLALQQTADGGYILGGTSASNISGDKTENSMGLIDYWVVKMDPLGTIQWQKTIGGSDYETIRSLQQTTDGGYILGGYSASNISGDKTENCFGKSDYWVVKLDAAGAIQWQNTIGGNNFDDFSSLQQTADGGYILGGSSYSNMSGDKTENSLGNIDFWVVKLDATGIIKWQNTIGGNDGDQLTSIQQTADGGYILGGSSYSNISGDKTENAIGSLDYWVVKLDALGTIQWQHTIGGEGYDFLSTLQQTSDGGYILGGYSTSNISGDKTENSLGDSDYWVLRLDATGAIQWQNTIGGDVNDELHSIDQSSDGGYILGGYSASNISGDKTENNFGRNDYWVVKLNNTGEIQWQKTLGGNDDDNINFLQQTADGGYILGGYSDSNISGNKTDDSKGDSDYWVIKLATESVPTVEAPTASLGLSLYPNPATDAVFVSSKATTKVSLRNAFGQMLSTQIIQGQGKIDISRYPNGIYFLIEMETGVGHKILKVK